MYILQMDAQCATRFFEVLPDEAEKAELTLKEAVSHILLDLFGGGIVDDVSISFSSHMPMTLQQCSIQIRAQCVYPHFSLLPHPQQDMSLALELRIGALLKELFGSVYVETLTFRPSPADYGPDPAFSHYI